MSKGRAACQDPSSQCVSASSGIGSFSLREGDLETAAALSIGLGKHPAQSWKSPTETTVKHSFDLYVMCTIEMKKVSTLDVHVVKRYPRGPDVFISIFLAWSPRATANQLTGMLVRCLLSKIASNAPRNIFIIYTSSASQIRSFNSFIFFLSLLLERTSIFRDCPR